MKEADIVRRILAYLNGLPNCHAQKLHGDQYGVAGSPDIFGSYNSTAFLLEAKVPGGKLRPSQENQLRIWAATGARTAVVYDLADAKKVIEEIDRVHADRL